MKPKKSESFQVGKCEQSEEEVFNVATPNCDTYDFNESNKESYVNSDNRKEKLIEYAKIEYIDKTRKTVPRKGNVYDIIHQISSDNNFVESDVEFPAPLLTNVPLGDDKYDNTVGTKEKVSVKDERADFLNVTNLSSLNVISSHRPVENERNRNSEYDFRPSECEKISHMENSDFTMSFQ